MLILRFAKEATFQQTLFLDFLSMRINAEKKKKNAHKFIIITW